MTRGTNMDILQLFIRYQLLILLLTPFLLFALWIGWLERERPRTYMVISVISVALYVSLAAVVAFDSILRRTISLSVAGQLLGAFACVILLVGKFESRRKKRLSEGLGVKTDGNVGQK